MANASESVVTDGRFEKAIANVLQEVNERSDEGTSSNPDTLLAKILAIVVLFVVTCMCGFVPFVLNRYLKWTSASKKSPRSAATVKCLLFFGGGVLLATTFLHLYPEVQEVCEDLQRCQMLPDMPFDLPATLMCCGFFLMYLLEEIMHTYMHHRKNSSLLKNKTGAAFERGHSIRRSILLKENGKENCHSERISSIVSQSSLDSTAAIVKSDIVCCGTESEENICQVAEEKKYTVLDLSNQKSPYDHYDSHHDHHHHSHEADGHSHMPVLSEDDNFAASMKGLGLVLALSLHELFEGLAIGLESSSSSVWFTCGAVAAHKLVLSFCVGMELVVARTRKMLAIIYILTFSIVTPIGIAIGILVTLHDSNTTPSLASAILQGIASGTLLYVVFFEILTKNHAGWWAYLTMLIGFGLMFGLQILGSDADSHSGVEAHCAA